MKFNIGRLLESLAFVCAMLLSISASAQTDNAAVLDTVYVGGARYMRITVFVPLDGTSPSVSNNVKYTTGNNFADHVAADAGHAKAASAGTAVQSGRGRVYETPLMMGVKTNLVGAALVIPNLAVEVQFLEKFSAEIQAYNTSFNVFNNFDENAHVYGFSPEVRFWPGGRTMRKGQFIGLHARTAWYTLQWKDGFLYQNGPEIKNEENYYNPGNSSPAWSLGVTYGYSLGFGKKGNWGLEFLLGVGYTNNKYNKAVLEDGLWTFVEHNDRHQFGITRASVNLAYRFSLRKVNPKYYDNN